MKLFFLFIALLCVINFYSARASIASSFVVQKDSYRPTPRFIESQALTGGENSFTFRNSYLIKVCSSDCDLQFDNVQLYDDFFLKAAGADSITEANIVSVQVTPLDNYTIANSVVDGGNCVGAMTQVGDSFVFQNCSLLSQSNNNQIQFCEHAVSKSNTQNKLSKSLGRLKKKAPIFFSSASMEELFSDPSLLTGSQCNSFAITDVCLSFRVRVTYQVITSYNECPLVNTTNNIQANSTHCQCNLQSMAQKYGKIHPMLKQCGQNISYCSLDSDKTNTLPITSLLDFSDDQTTSFSCVSQDTCNDCAKLLNETESGCSYSKVVCTLNVNNLGTSPVHFVADSISQDPTTNGLIPVSVQTSACESGKLPDEQATCKLGGLQNETVVITYCVKRQDSNTTTLLSTSVVYTNPCDSISGAKHTVPLTSTVDIEAQNVCVEVTKEALSGTSLVCPQNRTSPGCLLFRVNATNECGCISSTDSYITDDLSQFISLGASINLVNTSGGLICNQPNVVDPVLRCSFDGTANASTTLSILYTVCFANCSFCRVFPEVEKFSLVNTAVVNYTAGINIAVSSASLESTLVCPCDNCLCEIKVGGLEIRGINSDANAPGMWIDNQNGLYPNHYYQGSDCTVTRANDSSVVLGVFSYGYYGFSSGGIGWDCVTPSCNISALDGGCPPNTLSTPNCQCDRSFNNTEGEIPRYLRCMFEELVNVSCCASNAAFPNGPITGIVEIHACNVNSRNSFTCLNETVDFSITDPSVRNLVAKRKEEKKRKKALSCNSAATEWIIEYPAFQNTGSQPARFYIDAFNATWADPSSPPTFDYNTLVISSTDSKWAIPDSGDVTSISSAPVPPKGLIGPLTFRYSSTGGSTSNSLTMELTVRAQVPNKPSLVAIKTNSFTSTCGI